MEKLKENWQWINLAAVVIVAGILISCAASNSLWSDEVGSLDLVNHGWGEMAKLASGDVHPPLYYFILKIGVEIGRLLGINAIFAGKLISCIPFLLIFLFLGNKVRMQQGVRTASIFNLCMAGMPNLLDYAIEIRGYSWALFFVTALFVYGYEIVDSPKKSSWVCFTLFGILAAYTHYFSALAAVLVYFILLSVQDKKGRKSWCISVAAACLAYIPWIFVFLQQFGKVIGEFWIPEITWDSILGYFEFIFAPRISTMHLDAVLGIALCAGVIFLYYLELKKGEKDKRHHYYMAGGLVLFGTAAIGIAVSIALRPVLVSRYLVAEAGCLWLSFAWLISRNRIKKIVLIINFLLLFLVAFIDVGQLVRWEEIRKGYYEDFSVLLEQIGAEDVVITNGEHMHYCLSYYLQREIPQVTDSEETVKILDRAEEEEQRVWYFETAEEADDRQILETICEEYDMKYIDEYHLEYYSFLVYSCQNMS